MAAAANPHLANSRSIRWFKAPCVALSCCSRTDSYPADLSNLTAEALSAVLRLSYRLASSSHPLPCSRTDSNLSDVSSLAAEAPGQQVLEARQAEAVQSEELVVGAQGTCKHAHAGSGSRPAFFCFSMFLFLEFFY